MSIRKNEDLLAKRKGYFARHPFWSWVIFIFSTVTAVAVLWNVFTGQTVLEALMALKELVWPALTYEACLEEAGENFREIMECEILRLQSS